MSEAVAGRVPAERRREAERPREDVRPPPLGVKVGGYRLERRLGEGGQGTVYRARRGGRLYAIKFLSLDAPDWAWRELEVRLRLRHVGDLVVEAHGPWPHKAPRFLYLVTPYVHGRPLYEWAKEKNPTARDTTHLMLELTRQTVEIHRAGVVHRDIKGANVLVRQEDGRPVLVDFGVGTYVGAPEITRPLGLPGTRHYRSPEALRFRREHAGEHSPARASDDLWALGVVLYWLLTGGYPFDTEVADAGVLADLILREEPEPPHECNPRVPRALSELCLRMLEKSPQARYPDAEALGAALEAVLAEADATWDVPLCETWSPNDATTPQEERLDLGDMRNKLRRLLRYMKRHTRRGRPVSLEKASTLSRPPESERPDSPPVETHAVPWHALAWSSAAWVLGLMGWVLLHPLSGPIPEVTPPTFEVFSVPTMLEVTKSSQELASPAKPLDGGRSAAPEGATTPAPPTHVKTSKQTPQKKKQGTVFDTTGKTCTLVWLVAGQLACVSHTVQGWPIPTPPLSNECPPGSVQAMRDLGLDFIRRSPTLDFPNPLDERYTTVRLGPGATLKLVGDTWGKLPRNTVFSGVLFSGETHVYGHFTMAFTPDGHTIPVCMDLWQTAAVRGVEKEPHNEQGTARVRAFVGLKPVERFE